MRTIQITIQVPDGVDVKVTQGGQQSKGGGKEFVERPEPPYPEGVYCEQCGNDEWRLVKAGFSKTKKNPDGSPKRFNAFYTCATQNCDGKPPRERDEDSSGYVDQLPF